MDKNVVNSVTWLGKQNTDLWMMSDGNAQKLICACHWFWFCNASNIKIQKKILPQNG